jgi:hypothetical protein
MSLQTLVVDAYLVEGQFLFEAQILETERFLIIRAGTRSLTVAKREGQNLESR